MSNLGILMNMLKSGGNPQAILQNIVNQQAQNNPMMQNVLGLMNNKDAKGIEIIARNLCSEKHIDPDKMLADIQKQFNSR